MATGATDVTTRHEYHFGSRADLGHPPLARGGGPRSGGGVVANEFNRRHVSR